MTPMALFAGVVLLLLGAILFYVWRMVRSPLPLEMQEALEQKTRTQLGLLKEEWSSRLAEEMGRVWRQVQEQVRTTEGSVSQKLHQANETFARVTQELGRVQKATEQVEAVGRNVASLQEMLRSPKIRGAFGESLLGSMLSQIMPGDFYSLQYEFESGERVDAVVRLGSQLVPVDAKFPLEQFRRMQEAATDEERAHCRRAFLRDVKKHIDVIAEKYIRPSEGTFDFALMYIPAENVYYETIIKEEGASQEAVVFNQALERRVIPVSPNSLYAYLQVVIFGLRGLSVERQAREILAGLGQLGRELAGVREDFDRASKQLKHAAENFERADRRLGRFEGRLESVSVDPTTASGLPMKEAAQGEEG